MTFGSGRGTAGKLDIACRDMLGEISGASQSDVF